jgi:hypothetical protein
MDPYLGSATGATVTSQVDGGTDLASTNQVPGARSTTMLCNRRDAGNGSLLGDIQGKILSLAAVIRLRYVYFRL